MGRSRSIGERSQLVKLGESTIDELALLKRRNESYDAVVKRLIRAARQKPLGY